MITPLPVSKFYVKIYHPCLKVIRNDHHLCFKTILNDYDLCLKVIVKCSPFVSEGLL